MNNVITVYTLPCNYYKSTESLIIICYCGIRDFEMTWKGCSVSTKFLYLLGYQKKSLSIFNQNLLLNKAIVLNYDHAV